MTGRQPHRNGMGDTAVDIAGFGLADKEVTLAEVLSEVGDATAPNDTDDNGTKTLNFILQNSGRHESIFLDLHIES